MTVEQITKHLAAGWTWVKAVDPAWVSAIAAVIGVAVALGVVVRWCVLRRDLRGSGAAILALLGESDLEAFTDLEGRGRAFGIEHSSEIVYFKVGADRYFLCKRDLERLHALGYVYRKEHQYHLARLGRLLLDRYDNARLLAKGVARAKRGGYLRCNGRLWLRCRCEKYWLAGHERARIPFPLGRWWDQPATVVAAVVATASLVVCPRNGFTSHAVADDTAGPPISGAIRGRRVGETVKYNRKLVLVTHH